MRGQKRVKGGLKQRLKVNGIPLTPQKTGGGGKSERNEKGEVKSWNLVRGEGLRRTTETCIKKEKHQLTQWQKAPSSIKVEGGITESVVEGGGKRKIY